MVDMIVETSYNNIASKKITQATIKMRHCLWKTIRVYPWKITSTVCFALIILCVKMFNYEIFKLELTLRHVGIKTMQRNQINKTKNTLMHACFDDKKIRQK